MKTLLVYLLSYLAELDDDIQFQVEPENAVAHFAYVLVLSRNISSYATHDAVMRLGTTPIVDDI